jgi:hypothetical protein
MSKYAKTVEQFYTCHCSVTSLIGEHVGIEGIMEKSTPPEKVGL